MGLKIELFFFVARLLFEGVRSLKRGCEFGACNEFV